MTTILKQITAMRWLQATAPVCHIGSESIVLESGFNYDPNNASLERGSTETI